MQEDILDTHKLYYEEIKLNKRRIAKNIGLHLMKIHRQKDILNWVRKSLLCLAVAGIAAMIIMYGLGTTLLITSTPILRILQVLDYIPFEALELAWLAVIFGALLWLMRKW